MQIKKIISKIKSLKEFIKGEYLKNNPHYIKGFEIESDPIYIRGKKMESDPFYFKGKQIFNNLDYIKVQELTKLELTKNTSRTEVINFLLSQTNKKTNYLEIGVRNPSDNYNHILADQKFSVDPGIEFKSNPVDFKMTSDAFFNKLSNNEILDNTIKFDVIFIDGLHLAEQVNKDIENALNFITDDGFIVLHDCNPPSEWHAREEYNFPHTPADEYWNGTTWKAFLKWRCNPSINSCCINTDWGLGILSKNQKIGKNINHQNFFYEYKILDKNREYYLNLIDFSTLKSLLSK